MKEVWNMIQMIFAGIGGFFGWFVGGFDGFLYALLTFVILDYITGLMCAVVNRKLSSDIGFRGIFKKVLIFIMVGVGHIIDVRIIGSGAVLRTAIIFFYCSNEGISLLENAALIGLRIPERLKNVLAQLNNEGDGSDD
ncbi:MAG: phage holin family protein [Ruthenibacterium sp.]